MEEYELNNKIESMYAKNVTVRFEEPWCTSTLQSNKVYIPAECRQHLRVKDGDELIFYYGGGFIGITSTPFNTNLIKNIFNQIQSLNQIERNALLEILNDCLE